MLGDHYGNYKRSVEGKRVNRDPNYVEGWWENIAARPVYVRDKHELKRICEAESKRQGPTIIPRIFAKAKSNGPGIEWSF